MRDDRQPETGERCNLAHVAADRDHRAATFDAALARLDAAHPSVLDVEAGDLGALVDVDAEPGGCRRVAPNDRVVPDDGTRWMVGAPENRVALAATGQVDLRAEPLHLF